MQGSTACGTKQGSTNIVSPLTKVSFWVFYGRVTFLCPVRAEDVANVLLG